MTSLSTVIKRLFLLLPLVYSNQGQETSNWSYAESNQWFLQFPQCGGRRQSPIHLLSAASTTASLQPIRFSFYDIPLTRNLTLTNTGHTVEMEVPPTINGRRPFISGGILRSNYEAVGVHFHWGNRNSRGSEHVINNRRFDMEMHIVHRNVRYPTVEEATRNADGVAVLGIMFKTVRRNDRFYPGLNRIFNRLPAVVQYRSRAPIDGNLTLGQLLGDLNTKNFFTYHGSLTTPACAEAVTWHVFPNPLPIAFDQIRRFWSILDDRGRLLVNNFRPLQQRNGRPVLYRAAGAVRPRHHDG